MTLKEFRKQGIFKTKIDLGQFFPDEEEGTVWLELREPTQAELIEITSTTENSMGPVLGDMLPSLIVDHTLMDGNKRASAEAIAEVVKDSSSMSTYIYKTWMDSLPLAKKTPEKSQE